MPKPVAQNMFDTLLTLPLFQGLGHADLTRILESTRLQFETVGSGSTIVRQDALCNGVTFVLAGSVVAERTAADRSWRMEETLPTPSAIGIDALYGTVRTYSHTCTAQTQTRLLTVDKRTVAALTAYFEVFRINMLNHLSAMIARSRQPLWLPAPERLEERIVAWMREHVERPAGHKTFHITMRTLGRYLGEDYRYVSHALHNIETHGLLSLRRRMIDIPSFELLLQDKATYGTPE